MTFAAHVLWYTNFVASLPVRTHAVLQPLIVHVVSFLSSFVVCIVYLTTVIISVHRHMHTHTHKRTHAHMKTNPISKELLYLSLASINTSIFYYDNIMYCDNFSNVAIRFFLSARAITATENNDVLDVMAQAQNTSPCGAIELTHVVS